MVSCLSSEKSSPAARFCGILRQCFGLFPVLVKREVKMGHLVVNGLMNAGSTERAEICFFRELLPTMETIGNLDGG